MQNEMIDLMKQFNESAIKSTQRVAELNMKTFETLAAKQNEVVSACFETGAKNAELLAKIKDYKDLVNLQKDVVTECSTKWVSNVREAVETLTAVRNEWVAIFEEMNAYSATSAEQAVELGKKATAANMAKAVEAVEKAAAQTVEVAQDVATMTKENTEKAVAAAEDAVAKTVKASKKAAAQATEAATMEAAT